MTMELRKLVFSAEELREAIGIHGRHAGVPMPKGPPDEIEVIDGPQDMLLVRFDTPGPRYRPEYRITRDQVVAAIILYCREGGIPLPRLGRKELVIEKGALTMVVSIHWGR